MICLLFGLWWAMSHPHLEAVAFSAGPETLVSGKLISASLSSCFWEFAVKTLGSSWSTVHTGSGNTGLDWQPSTGISDSKSPQIFSVIVLYYTVKTLELLNVMYSWLHVFKSPLTSFINFHFDLLDDKGLIVTNGFHDKQYNTKLFEYIYFGRNFPEIWPGRFALSLKHIYPLFWNLDLHLPPGSWRVRLQSPLAIKIGKCTVFLLLLLLLVSHLDPSVFCSVLKFNFEFGILPWSEGDPPKIGVFVPWISLRYLCFSSFQGYYLN